MLKRMRAALEKPPLYTKSKENIWNDSYISKQMLRAHLDPDCEGASRKLDFIERSVAWIKELVAPARYPALLDLGCGPGIYAERFAKAGYQVTGIDFSKSSIDYAAASAMRQGLHISYLCQDYLNMECENIFDFGTMIYCDYGALSTSDRQIIMRKVYQHLRPGGKFLLDVYGMAQYNTFKECRTWNLCDAGGFWCAEKYLELSGHYKYPDTVTLEQTSVISGNEIKTCYIWNTCFTKESLMQEAREAGFWVCGIWGDVTGSPYRDDGPTIAILLEKEK